MDKYKVKYNFDNDQGRSVTIEAESKVDALSIAMSYKGFVLFEEDKTVINMDKVTYIRVIDSMQFPS